MSSHSDTTTDIPQNALARFLKQESAGAIVLVAATVLSFLLANSGIHETVSHLWETEAGFAIGQFHFEQSLLHWVDDALMALFFLVVGFEIKREFIVGELATARGAALPIVAALGGMLAPALIFYAFNPSGPASVGWGVPMATDIAFALGILALLGSRIPTGLKVFLAALAIADDLGAILVIALFYTSDLQIGWLIFALVPLVTLFIFNRLKVDQTGWYLAIGTVLWFAILNSGIHATIAGVITALMVPAVAKLSPLEFTEKCRTTIDEIEACHIPDQHTLADNRQQRLALGLTRYAAYSAAPLQRLEFALLPFTTFVVLPLFALGNAGVPIGGEGIDLSSNLVYGVVLGLLVGKPIGITLASWIAVKSGIASLPKNVRWSHIAGAGMLGGIGFTMSMFVANLAFGTGALGDDVKIAILVASVTAGLLGYSWLRWAAPAPRAASEPE